MTDHDVLLDVVADALAPYWAGTEMSAPPAWADRPGWIYPSTPTGWQPSLNSDRRPTHKEDPQMRIDRFQSFALQAYRQAPEIATAEPYSDGTSRPAGIELKIAGKTVRHALTRVRTPGEAMDQPEPTPVEGAPAEPIEPRPAPGGARDRQTATYLAAVLASAGNPEIARAYPYDENSQHAGLGVEFHSGAKIHMLLM